MAEIWRVYDGREPTRGESWATFSLDDAIALLELQPEHLVADPTRTPRFGDKDDDLWFRGYQHVVVEIVPSESRPPDWVAGFYLSPVPPKDALNRILHSPDVLNTILYNKLAPVLGERNVLRIAHVPSTDSSGQNTLRVTAVLAPEGPQRITGEMAIGAIGQLQSVLTDFGIEGTPVLQYATEAELADVDND